MDRGLAHAGTKATVHRFGGVRQQDRKGRLKVKAELYAKLCASRHWCMSRGDSVKVILGLQVCVYAGTVE